jgi:hypothetical protein
LVGALFLLVTACGVHQPDVAASPAVGKSLDAQGALQPGAWRIFRGLLSPDGRQVAFWGIDPIANPTVGIAQQGKPVAVTPPSLKASDFAWMPDSASLLVSYHVDSHDDFAVLRLDGTKVRDVIPQDALRNDFENGIAVRPDGKVALVAAMPPGTGARAAHLVQLDLTDGKTSNLTPTSDLSEDLPSYVDEHQVVYVSSMLNSPDYAPQLKLLNLDSGHARTLSDTSQFVRSASVTHPASVAIYDAFASGGGGSPSMWSVSLDGKAPVHLVGEGYTWPSVDQSGSWVLVTEVGSPGRRGGLRLLPVKPLSK